MNGETNDLLATVIVFWFTSILPILKVATTTCSFLFNNSKVSPTFKDDLSIGVLNVSVVSPVT